MTIHSLLDRFRQLLSWLWYQHEWTAWELTAAAGVVLLLLLWVAKKRQAERRTTAMTHLIRQSSSVIGPRLAGRNLTAAAETAIKRPRLPFLPVRNGRDTATQSAIASDQTASLPPHETTRDQHTEPYLQQQLNQLKAANEKLQNQNTQCKQNEHRLQQRIARLLTTGKRLRQELTKLEHAEQTLRKEVNSVSQQLAGKHRGGTGKHARWSPLELFAPDGLPRRNSHPQRYEADMLPLSLKRDMDSRRAKEPLDVEKLKAIAELARQIQSRPRRS